MFATILFVYFCAVHLIHFTQKLTSKSCVNEHVVELHKLISKSKIDFVKFA